MTVNTSRINPKPYNSKTLSPKPGCPTREGVLGLRLVIWLGPYAGVRSRPLNANTQMFLSCIAGTCPSAVYFADTSDLVRSHKKSRSSACKS